MKMAALILDDTREHGAQQRMTGSLDQRAIAQSKFSV
jgi:hypothetical protein